MKRETVSKSKSQRRREAIQAEAKAADTKEALKDELDAVLDEVDAVLEQNAAEFVASYVQKGGE
jgi:ubiquitin-like protein Pup